jgi:hypothetical protein
MGHGRRRGPSARRLLHSRTPGSLHPVGAPTRRWRFSTPTGPELPPLRVLLCCRRAPRQRQAVPPCNARPAGQKRRWRRRRAHGARTAPRHPRGAGHRSRRPCVPRRDKTRSSARLAAASSRRSRSTFDVRCSRVSSIRSPARGRGCFCFERGASCDVTGTPSTRLFVRVAERSSLVANSTASAIRLPSGRRCGLGDEQCATGLVVALSTRRGSGADAAVGREQHDALGVIRARCGSTVVLTSPL